MEVILYSILPTFIGTIITLFITEKVKGNVKNSFDNKLEKLKKEHSIEITKFQAEINSLKSKENFKFTKLHEKRMNVLEESYKLLNRTIPKLNSYISPAKFIPNDLTWIENEDKLQEEFLIEHNKFTQHFTDNKIYFDEDLEELIENYIRVMRGIYNDYSENHYLKKMGEEFDKEARILASKAYKKVPSILAPIKKEIEIKFRNLLTN